MPKKVNRNPGVAKRGDKWRARAFSDGKEISKSFSTQDEAIRWKREQERALERGEWIDPSLSSVNFTTWASDWMKAKTNASPSTMRGYNKLLQNHLIPEFGNQRLTAITHNGISQWVKRNVDKGSGLVVIKRAHSLLRQILKGAVLDGRLSRNPAIGVTLPRTKPKEKKALSLEQLQELAQACIGYETFILFAGTTGLRWGELAALQCKDVSILNRTVSVTKGYTKGIQGERVLSGTKTHQNRTVPVARDLLKTLSDLISTKSPDSHLFEMPGGGSLEYNNFQSRIFRPAVIKAGLTGISFHSLRHTTASLLISQGTPITTVAGILGHASTQMTLNVYGHLYEDDAMKYIDRLGDSLFTSGTAKERPKVISVSEKLSV
jgi:integrase